MTSARISCFALILVFSTRSICCLLVPAADSNRSLRLLSHIHLYNQKYLTSTTTSSLTCTSSFSPVAPPLLLALASLYVLSSLPLILYPSHLISMFDLPLSFFSIHVYRVPRSLLSSAILFFILALHLSMLFICLQFIDLLLLLIASRLSYLLYVLVPLLYLSLRFLRLLPSSMNDSSIIKKKKSS